MRYAIFVFMLFSAGIAVAQETREPDLQKGINFSNWLANAERQPMNERDFQQVKKAGFDTIRLPVKPLLLGKNTAAVDKAVVMAVRSGLTLVIDLHPDKIYMQNLETTPEGEQKLIDMWVAAARHFKNYRADKIVFELLNEPQFYKKEEQYNALMEKLVTAIREVDRDRYLIIGAPRGSSIEGLQKLKTLEDAKIFYAFHFYKPYMVTHQGIHRGFETTMLRYFHDVPYPSVMVNRPASRYAENAPDMAKAEAELKEYVAKKWNADRIAEALKPAKDWANLHKAKIICSEFGVLRNHIDSASRYRWISDVRRALESYEIGWQLWDYTDLDGIVTLTGKTSTDPIDGSIRLADPEQGSREIEKEAIYALGLVPSSATAPVVAPAGAVSPVPPGLEF